MAGNGRFELTSASPDSGFAGNYPNGQRGSYSASLDRSGSFREGAESRMFGSGKPSSKGSASSTGDLPALSQCLTLDPIVLGDKYPRSSELKRALGCSAGSSSEENTLSSGLLKSPSAASIEELKRLRASVVDTYIKASGRAKKLDDQLSKLNKYVEVMTSKKQQRNELSNERSSSSSLKIGTQIHRSSLELGTQKYEDRPKNGVLNKRVRTSVAETRAECRSGLPRQSLLMTKEREYVKDSNADSEMAEEKIRRLPAGGEGWDKKMKRKRSVGAVFSRPIDGEGEVKRAMHHKITSEPGLQSSDSSHVFRSGASSGNAPNKMDSSSSPASSGTRGMLKTEQEKSAFPKDPSSGLSKERILAKGNLKLTNREDNHAICPSPIVKGKASRAPRSGSTVVSNQAVNVPRVSGTLDGWDQPQGVNKNPSMSGPNNRKRAMPTGSSSPPITQWVGQRPQKISRTRRTNLVSPVSNHDEAQIPSEGCSPSDFGTRSSGANGSAFSKNATSGTQNLKVKTENVSSPARLSESEESGAIENRMKEKALSSGDLEEKATNAVQNLGSSVAVTKKSKNVVKEEIGDGVRRQGRSGRGSPFSRVSISPTGEKLDTPVSNKPPRSVRSGSDKNGSKSGRPLKKLSDRKGFSRLGHVTNGGSPDCSGESEDDREELLAVANSACKSCLQACSTQFWKRLEAWFTSIGSDEKSFLSEQLKLAEEYDGSPSQMLGQDNNVQGNYSHEEIKASESLHVEKNSAAKSKLSSKDSAGVMEFIDQMQNSSPFGNLDSERRLGIVTPFYQRVLSALIVEDEIEEYEENGFGRCVPLQNAPRNSSDNMFFVDAENRDRIELVEPVLGVQAQKNGNGNIYISCNGNAHRDRSPSTREHPCNGEVLHGDSKYMHSEFEMLFRVSTCDLDGEQKSCGFSSFNCQYEQMGLEDRLILELQSVGVYLEAVPALDDKEDERISQEIIHLKSGLNQQAQKKKKSLDKILHTVEEGKDAERRDPEEVAMDKLVELAYKKLLATRGSFASKHGITKVSKQVALAFAKRILAKCRKYEESGVSCFADPALRDIVYATPPRVHEVEPLAGSNPPAASGSLHGYADGSSINAFDTSTHLSDQAFAKNGPISNRGKKKEVLLDDVGGSVFRAASSLGILGGAKGKRSERDRDRDNTARGAVAKAGRSSMGGSKGERKAKAKPKQKTAQLSTSGNGFVNNGSGESANNSGSRKKDVRFMSSGNAPPEPKENKDNLDFSNLPLNDIDVIDELGVDSETGAPQDFNNWFNFEVDGLQDDDSIGLEIPMDDLSELNMF